MMRWEAVPVQEGHSCTEYLCMCLGNWLAEGYLSGSPATAPRSHDYPTHHAIAPAVHHHVLSITSASGDHICSWQLSVQAQNQAILWVSWYIPGVWTLCRRP